jgi:hypothetical protein
MMVKIHFRFNEHIGEKKRRFVYLCNWAVKPSKERFAKNDNEVTCNNCLRIMKNFRIKRDKR